MVFAATISVELIPRLETQRIWFVTAILADMMMSETIERRRVSRMTLRVRMSGRAEHTRAGYVSTVE